MSVIERQQAVAERAQALALEGYQGPGTRKFGSHPAWQALRAAGTQLWLDTGDLDAAAKLWTNEFSNLTTNNTLVNKEVQKGIFDDLIRHAGKVLREADGRLSEDDLVIEVGFVVNCHTALRLVEAFGATVSVELHPAMSDDAALSVDYGRRYYQVCPERFIIKVPLTPAGFLAARQLAADGIPVNYTLGFSARQNVLAAAFSRPAYVNVFMGRLNSFVADGKLGDGKNVGEKATMATQLALLEGRRNEGWTSRLIGASMRSAEQAFNLAGLDVFTLPTAVAEEFRRLYEANSRPIESQVGRDFPVHGEPASVLECLWTVDEGIRQAARALSGVNPSGWQGADFARFVRENGAPDLFRDWTPKELEQIREDGKIPNWGRWKDELLSGRLALDDLMTTSALFSFVTDQAALDEHIRKLLRATA